MILLSALITFVCYLTLVDTDKDQVKEIKKACFDRPGQKLFQGIHGKYPEIEKLFHYLKGLHYASRPDYMTVRHLLSSIRNRMKSAITQAIS